GGRPRSRGRRKGLSSGWLEPTNATACRHAWRYPRLIHRGSTMNARFDLTGRSVIIPGGGKGIGKVYAQEFAKAGARVVAADIDGAAAVAAALAAEGLQAAGCTTDIADEQSTRAMAQAA